MYSRVYVAWLGRTIREVSDYGGSGIVWHEGRAMAPQRVLATFFGMTIVCASIASASMIYVDDSASGANNGSSWTDAFVELQSALAVAQGDDDIWIAAGTYTPDFDVNTQTHTGNRVMSFSLINGVGVYGGFAGTEDPATFDLADRDFVANATILSGDLNGDDKSTGSKADNSYHVVSQPPGSDFAILDGFVIQDGYADGVSVDQQCGGGVYGTAGALSIRACRIVGNFSASYGGGVYLAGPGSHTTLDACHFGDNGGPAGGAMCISDSAYADIRDCSFLSNTATMSLGGAIYMKSTAQNPTTITRCSFDSNMGQQSGGAIFSHCSSRLQVIDTTFTRNSCQSLTGEGGGAVYYNSVFLRMSNCTFSENTSPLSGAVHLEVTQAAIVNCRFLSNENGRDGGGLYNRFADATVTNCLFANNIARNGGGAYDSESNVAYANCTFADNSALSGGGIMVQNSTGTQSTTAANSILWGNSDQQNSGEESQVYVASGTFAVNYSCIQGWTGALGGTGNMGEDPLFYTGDAFYHVQGNSPAIDAASNALVPADTNDLDGDADTAEPTPLALDVEPRFKDVPFVPETGAGTVPIVDMGCYEYFVDCDNNSVFDTCDFSCGDSGGPCDMPGCGQEPDCNQNQTIDACESDRDNDGLIDDCDDDDDNDSVVDPEDNCPLVANIGQEDSDVDSIGDACDDCPGTISGIAVDEAGCPPLVPGDMDRDGDVDMEDFGVMQACLSGSSVPQTMTACQNTKLDEDEDVDADDMRVFLGCLSAANTSADPACAD